MKRRSLFIFCLIIGITGLGIGQTRSLTNNDLEKYRQQRLRAEREYRENYARWGFPSPEELDRRRAESQAETLELAAKLRQEALQRDSLEAQREAAERWVLADAPAYSRYDSDFFLPYQFWSNGRRTRSNRGTRHYQQPGYFAGGQFWPTGPSTRPRPMFRIHRR